MEPLIGPQSSFKRSYMRLKYPNGRPLLLTRSTVRRAANWPSSLSVAHLAQGPEANPEIWQLWLSIIKPMVINV